METLSTSSIIHSFAESSSPAASRGLSSHSPIGNLFAGRCRRRIHETSIESVRVIPRRLFGCQKCGGIRLRVRALSRDVGGEGDGDSGGEDETVESGFSLGSGGNKSSLQVSFFNNIIVILDLCV